MDEQTNRLIAAQLTAAYFAANAGDLERDERTADAVIAKYQEMTRLLGESDDSSFVGAMPETGDVR